MKFFSLLLLGMTLVSCEMDLDDENISFEKVAAFDIVAPSNLTVNFECDVSFNYALVDSCSHFYNMEFESPTNGVREITAFIEVDNNQNCSSVYSEHTHTFQFKPVTTGTYIFKFWNGIDVSGADLFETHEITVTN